MKVAGILIYITLFKISIISNHPESSTKPNPDPKQINTNKDHSSTYPKPHSNYKKPYQPWPTLASDSKNYDEDSTSHSCHRAYQNQYNLPLQWANNQTTPITCKPSTTTTISTTTLASMANNCPSAWRW